MSNGQLPRDQLGNIPGTAQQVRKDLVTQTGALRAAFEKRFGKPLTITDSYRPYSVQERIFRQRYTTSWVTGIDPRRWLGVTWWRLPGTAAASVPGTSNHGWGQAIDFGSGVNVGNSPEHRWMVENAPRFGWSWPLWARRSPMYEPWHFEATAVPVSNYREFLAGQGVTVPGATPPTPIAPILLEEDMKVIRDETAGSIALIGEAYVGEFGGADTAGIAAATAVFGEWKNVPSPVYRVAVERAAGRMRHARTTLTAEQLAAQITPTLVAAIREAGTGATPEQVEERVRAVLRSV